MNIENIMNPNRKDIETDCTVRVGTPVVDLQCGALETGKEYIGVVNRRGTSIGAIRTERLRYIVERNQSMHFSGILDHLSIGVILIDTDSRIFYVNRAYEQILGVQAGKIIGRYLNQIEEGAGLLDVLRTGEALQRDQQYIKTVRKYVSVNMFPLMNGEKILGACSMFTDITRLNELSTRVEAISQEAEEYKNRLTQNRYFNEHHIIGNSQVYTTCLQKAIRVAKTDVTVLIRGENGTGKEVVANTIQQNSARRGKPFIKVNCAAIPESLMESELFGYEEGSFTGAKKGGRAGKFELAEGGTLFLDEIGDIPLPMQAKLLRVLQENEVERIGGSSPIPVDVRLLTATNQPLEEMIRDGKFRMDLYYRLKVVTIDIPALRLRGHDIVDLANEFLRQANEKYGFSKTFRQEAYIRMLDYTWPGNVRELRNTIESAVVLSNGQEITAEELPLPSRSADGSDGRSNDAKQEASVMELMPGGWKETTQMWEKQLLQSVLEECRGSRNEAMKKLQMPRRTFFRKMAEYGIQ